MLEDSAAERFVAALARRMSLADVLGACFLRTATPRWLGRETVASHVLAPPRAFDARSCTGAVVLEDSGRVAMSSNWRSRAADAAGGGGAADAAAAAAGGAAGSAPTAAASLEAWRVDPLRCADR